MADTTKQLDGIRTTETQLLMDTIVLAACFWRQMDKKSDDAVVHLSDREICDKKDLLDSAKARLCTEVDRLLEALQKLSNENPVAWSISHAVKEYKKQTEEIRPVTAEEITDAINNPRTESKCDLCGKPMLEPGREVYDFAFCVRCIPPDIIPSVWAVASLLRRLIFVEGILHTTHDAMSAASEETTSSLLSSMTLEQAAEHCREVEAETEGLYEDVSVQHGQIATWLEELQEFRERSAEGESHKEAEDSPTKEEKEKSGMIRSADGRVKYDIESGLLDITFASGRRYHFYSVPKRIATRILNALPPPNGGREKIFEEEIGMSPEAARFQFKRIREEKKGKADG